MIRYFLITILVVLGTYNCLIAQKENYQLLKVGERVPDYPLMNLVNYTLDSAKISDFQGKLLILDYWFTGCRPCIASWPKLEKLQKQFDGKLQIVLVNHFESESIVRKFIDRTNEKSGHRFSLPSVSGDEVLHKVIPPSFGYPSIAWIDGEGIYHGMTEGAELNEANITALLKGSSAISTPNDKKDLFEPDKPISGASNADLQLWHSSVLKYSESIPSGIAYVKIDSFQSCLTITNQSILELIRNAFGKVVHEEKFSWILRLPNSLFKVQVEHPNRIMSHSDGKLQPENLFTYQLIGKGLKTSGDLKRVVQSELEQYFGLDLAWEKVVKKCYVLTSADTTIISDFKTEDKPPGIVTYKDGTNGLRNMPVEKFLDFLHNSINTYYQSPYPIIDETDFKGGLDLLFDKSSDYKAFLGNPEALNNALKKYKMSFELKDREVYVLVIRDVKVEKQKSTF